MGASPPPSSWETGQQLGGPRVPPPLCAWTPESATSLSGAHMLAAVGPQQASGLFTRTPQGLLPCAAGVSAQVAAAAARLSVASAALQTAAAERAGIHQGLQRGPLGVPGVPWPGGPLGPTYRPLGLPVRMGPSLLRGTPDAALWSSQLPLPLIGAHPAGTNSRGPEVGAPRTLLPVNLPTAANAIGISLLLPSAPFRMGPLPAKMVGGPSEGASGTAVTAAAASREVAAAAQAVESAASAAAETTESVGAATGNSAAAEGGRIEQLMRCLRRGLVATAEGGGASVGAISGSCVEATAGVEACSAGGWKSIPPPRHPSPVSTQQPSTSATTAAATPTATTATATATAAAASAPTPCGPQVTPAPLAAEAGALAGASHQSQAVPAQTQQVEQQQFQQQQQQQQQLQQQQFLLQQQQLQLIQLQIQYLQQQHQLVPHLQQQRLQLQLQQQQQQRLQLLEAAQQQQQRQGRQQQQRPERLAAKRQQQQHGQQQKQLVPREDVATAANTSVADEGLASEGRFCSAPWSRTRCDVCAAAGGSRSSSSSSRYEGSWSLQDAPESDTLLCVSPRVAVAAAYAPQQPQLSSELPRGPSKDAVGPHEQQEAPLAAALGTAIKEADKLQDALSLLETSAAYAALAADTAAADRAASASAASATALDWQQLLQLAEEASEAFSANCSKCAVAMEIRNSKHQPMQPPIQQKRRDGDGMVDAAGATSSPSSSAAAAEVLGDVTSCLATKLAAEGSAVTSALRCICTSLAACCAAVGHPDEDAAAAPAAGAAAAPVADHANSRKWSLRGSIRGFVPLIRALPVCIKGLEHDQQQQQEHRKEEEQQQREEQQLQHHGDQEQGSEQQEEHQHGQKNQSDCGALPGLKDVMDRPPAASECLASLTAAASELPAAAPVAAAPDAARIKEATPIGAAAATVADSARAEAIANGAIEEAAAATEDAAAAGLDDLLVSLLQQTLTAPRQAAELCRYLQMLTQYAERLLDSASMQQRTEQNGGDPSAAAAAEAAAALLSAADRVEGRLVSGLRILQRGLEVWAQAFLSELQDALLSPHQFVLLIKSSDSQSKELTEAFWGCGSSSEVAAGQLTRNRRAAAAAAPEQTIKLARNNSSSSRLCPSGATGFPPAGDPVGVCQGSPRGPWGSLSLSHVLYRSLLGPSAPKGRGLKRPRHQSPRNCSSNSSSTASSPQAAWRQLPFNGNSSPWLPLHSPAQQQQQQQKHQQRMLLVQLRQQQPAASAATALAAAGTSLR